MTIKRDKYKTLRRKENISFQYNCNLKKKNSSLTNMNIIFKCHIMELKY